MKNNKKFSKKLLSMILAVSMILSLVPIFTAAIDDELSKYETVEEVPFTFTLEEGDLTFSELKDATLNAGDLPFAISAELAEERGHVNRLYEQETDDYTVMFQNRDGSKTIYLFSQKVKNLSISSTSTAALVSSGGEIVINKDNIIAKRLGTSSDNRIMDYQIARCEISTLTQGRLSADGVDITSQAKALANGEASGEELRIECAEVSGVATASSLASRTPQASVMSLTYSTVAGEYALKNNGTNRYMMLNPSARLTTSPSIYLPLCKWLISYEYVNSTYIYTLTPLARQMQRLTYSDGRVSCTAAEAGATNQKWEILIENNEDGSTFIYFFDYTLEYLLDPSFGSVDNSTVPLERCQWILTNHQTFVPLTSITTIINYAYYNELFSLDEMVAPYPENASYYNYKWEDAAGNSVPNSSSGFPYNEGTYELYCRDEYTGLRSPKLIVLVHEGSWFSEDITYTIHPKNAPTKYLTMQANAVSNVYNAESNNIVVEQLSSDSAKGSEKWDDISRAFLINRVNGGYKLTATLATFQYLNVPDASNSLTQSEIEQIIAAGGNTNSLSDAINNKLQVLNNYSVTTLDQQNNTLNIDFLDETEGSGGESSQADETEGSGGESSQASETEQSPFVCTKSYDAEGSNLILYPVDVVENNITTRYYRIIFYSPSAETYVLTYNGDEPLSLSESFSDDGNDLWKFNQLGVDVPVIKQTTNFWCGYATILQLLLSKGVCVSGDSIHEQTKRIIIDTNNELNSSAWQLDFHNYINGLTYDNNSFNMSCMIRPESGFSDQDKQNLKSRIISSLEKGYPAACMVSSAGPPYTEGTGSAHYVCIIGYDANSDRVIISNCHYNNDLNGVFAIPFSQFLPYVSFLYWQ